MEQQSMIEGGGLKCLLCDEKSISKYDLIRHICQHLSYRKYQCASCTEMFFTEEERESHCIQEGHIHAHEMKVSPYCELYVNLLLKDAQHAALCGTENIILERTKANLACDTCTHKSPEAEFDAEKNARDSPGDDRHPSRASEKTASKKKKKRNHKKKRRNRKNKKKVRGRERTFLRIFGSEPGRAISGVTAVLSVPPLCNAEEHFPWNRLPQQLRIRVLQNLRRIDLDHCRLLNRKTFKLIRSNENLMKRRVVDCLEIKRVPCTASIGNYSSSKDVSPWKREYYRSECSSVLLSFLKDSEAFEGMPAIVFKNMAVLKPAEKELHQIYAEMIESDLLVHVLCLEEETDKSLNLIRFHGIVSVSTYESIPLFYLERTSSALNKCLSKLLKNADVRELRITTLFLTDILLSTISSCLLHAGSRVHSISTSKLTMSHVTSAGLHRFLSDVDPTAIFFRGLRSCCLSPDVLRFMVTRSQFEVTCVKGDTFSIDDNILAELTASSFVIGAPNMITIDGLNSFIKRLANEKRRLTSGEISTIFPLNEVSFTYPSSSLRVVANGYSIKFSTEETEK